jgi:osmotically-inducible protein OsmY
MRQLLCVLTLLLTTLLSGCIAAVAMSSATGGLIVHDRRDLQTLQDDQFIDQQIQIKLSVDPVLSKTSRIIATSFNHIVLLVGQTPTKTLRIRATRSIKTVPKIQRIYNEITIGEPISSMTKTSDSWITTKVKATLLATTLLNATQIKVVTENGVVYLMGIVTHQQADVAVEIARRIDGVKRVVKVVEYKKLVKNT